MGNQLVLTDAPEQGTTADTKLVVLSADSIDTTKKTHSRYFGNIACDLVVRLRNVPH
ncbi:hypothetical protein [Mycolicibacterium sp.]|uniref:hypothetical protein n=1 Tax=Mycolicibacterium sp. TaxID=2320850 RepID=UPI0037C90A66